TVPMQGSSRPVASAAQQQGSSNTLKGTAERRMQQPPLPPVPPPSSLREVCPQCGARFGSVERLVQHAEEWHPVDTHTPVMQQHAPGMQQHAPAQWTSNPALLPPTAGGAAAASNTNSSSSTYGRRLGSAADASCPYRCPHCERGFN